MTSKTKNTIEASATETVATERVASSQISHDLKTAVLIISMVANLFILSAWIAIQVTTRYDLQIAGFLFTR